MKQLFTIIIILSSFSAIMSGCHNTKVNEGIPFGTDVSIVLVGSCSYVLAQSSQGGLAICHHENCPNPIHKSIQTAVTFNQPGDFIGTGEMLRRDTFYIMGNRAYEMNEKAKEVNNKKGFELY